MCKCKRCGQPVEDCLTLCIKCFLETSDDGVKKNIVAGGRFYERRTMREKIPNNITGTWRPDGWAKIRQQRGSDRPSFESGADCMIEAITEEIEKLENPYIKEERIYNHSRDDLKLGWYQCLDDILSLLRPKENITYAKVDSSSVDTSTCGNVVGNAEL